MGNTLLSTWEKTGNTDSADAATPDVWNASVTTATADNATWVMPPTTPTPAVAWSSAASVAAAILWFAASSWRSTASKSSIVSCLLACCCGGCSVAQIIQEVEFRTSLASTCCGCGKWTPGIAATMQNVAAAVTAPPGQAGQA